MHLLWAAYIKRLFNVRQQYKDALIYGAQLYQPATGEMEVAAYFYRSAQHDLITVVNASANSYAGRLLLNDAEADSGWRDLLNDTSLVAAGRKLPFDIPEKELRVMLRE